MIATKPLPFRFPLIFKALGLSLGLVAALAAQETAIPQNAPQNVPRADILVIDTSRLITASQLGQELRSELKAREEALAEEDTALEEQLLQEERELTQKRNTLPVDEFTALADAFDQKARETRAMQAEKYAALERESNELALQIYSAAKPIFADIMREAGAVMLIDQSNVIISAGQVNITDLAIERIDQALRTE